MVNQSDIVLYLSGSSVTDPQNSYGGAIQTVKVINKKKANLFPRTTLSEALTGINKYLCLYVQNKNASEGMNNVTVFISFNTDTEVDEVTIGKGSSGKNGVEQRVSNILTAPSNVGFSLAEIYNNGLNLGKLNAGDFYPVWFHLAVEINNEPLENQFGIKVVFDPPPGSTTGGSGEGGGSQGGGQNTPPPTIADFNLVAASDWSCNSQAKKTVSQMKTFSFEKLLTPGDLSYDSNGDCYISDNGDTVNKKTIWAPGNHDDSSSLRKKYLAAFGQSKEWSVTYFKNVMVLTLDAYDDFGVGSDQYNFIKGELEKQKANTNIDWRISMSHEDFYASPTHHGNLESLRNAYHPIFDANGLDLHIEGHNHNYARTYPVRYNSSNSDNPTVHSTGNPNYTNPDGVIFVRVGTAGRDLYPLDSQDGQVAYQTDSEFGFLMMNFTNNAQKLTGKFYRDSDLTIKDQFSITKT